MYTRLFAEFFKKNRKQGRGYLAAALESAKSARNVRRHHAQLRSDCQLARWRFAFDFYNYARVRTLQEQNEKRLRHILERK